MLLQLFIGVSVFIVAVAAASLLHTIIIEVHNYFRSRRIKKAIEMRYRRMGKISLRP